MKKSFLALTAIAVFAMAAQAQDVKLPEKPDRKQYVDYNAQRSGFFAAVQVAPTFFFNNVNNGSNYLTQLDLVAGYRVSEFFKVGFGISPRFDFSDFGGGLKFLPLYLDLRGNFISQEDRMFSPYWNLDAGYTLNAGFMLAPTLGFRFGGIRNDFLLGIGYVFQATSVKNIYQHGLAIRLGYEF